MDSFMDAFNQAMSQSWQKKMEKILANGSVEMDTDTEIQLKILWLTEIKNNLMDHVMDTALVQLQGIADGLVKKLEELSNTLAIDIYVPPRGQDVTLVEHKRQLQELVAKYSDVVEQRQKRAKLLQEWHNYLVTKIGIAKKDIKSDPLPSNEELDRIEARLGNQLIELNCRVEKFLLIQVEVKELMAELKMKPRNRFESNVLKCTSAEFRLHTGDLKRLTKLHQRLKAKYHAIKRSSNA